MIEDLDCYEGAFSDCNGLGYHSIDKNNDEVIRISKLDVDNNILVCHFEDIYSSYSNDEIEELIFIVLLSGFCADYYIDKANYVLFVNSKTGESWRVVYLG